MAHSPPGRGHALLSPNTSRSSTTADDCTRPSATERRSKHSPTTELWRPPQRDQPEDLSKILDTAQRALLQGRETAGRLGSCTVLPTLSVQVPARRAAERYEEQIAAWRERSWPAINDRGGPWRLAPLRGRIGPGARGRRRHRPGGR